MDYLEIYWICFYFEFPNFFAEYDIAGIYRWVLAIHEEQEISGLLRDGIAVWLGKYYSLRECLSCGINRRE